MAVMEMPWFGLECNTVSATIHKIVIKTALVYIDAGVSKRKSTPINCKPGKYTRNKIIIYIFIYKSEIYNSHFWIFNLKPVKKMF